MAITLSKYEHLSCGRADGLHCSSGSLTSNSSIPEKVWKFGVFLYQQEAATATVSICNREGTMFAIDFVSLFKLHFDLFHMHAFNHR